MALTTSLYTGLTGLKTSSRMLDVAGNNIANVNTTGYKKSVISFETAIAQSLASASAPSDQLGGTNPTQVGLGAKVGSITQDFASGSLEPTGKDTDMAIQGDGFFIVSNDADQSYTRAGNFNLDSDYNLVDSNGNKVMGYGVDKTGQIVPGVLTPIHIPLGNMTLAKATTDVRFTGNLNAAGDLATQGSINTSDPLYSAIGAAPPANGGTLMTNLYTATGVTPFLTAGDVITAENITKGGTILPTKTFTVGAASTLNDFMTFLQETTGIDSTADPSAGITLDASGDIVVKSNTGTVNGIALDGTDLVVNAAGPTPTQPFNFTDTQDANGESVRTTFLSYDSLGNQMNLNLNMVLEGRDSTGTQWRYYVQSDDSGPGSRALATGMVDFGTTGQMLNPTNPVISINRGPQGAASPQPITLELSSDAGSLSALSDAESHLAVISQDGAPIGNLTSFSVSNDGTLVGTFSNSLHENLGRAALAKFSNPNGLIQAGNSLYHTSSNSGAAQIGTATQAGLGKIVGQAIEQSNVDLSAEFVNLINASTGFSANSRVITTNEKLMQALLASIQ